MVIITNMIFRKKGLNVDLQLRFLHRLSRALANGYSLLKALETIAWDPQLKNAATKTIMRLQEGKTVDEALEHVSFHPSITSFLYFARSTGDLLDSLSKCIDLFEKRLQYRKKFQQIIRYPLILLFFASILLVVIKGTVLPSFLELFQMNPSASATIGYSIVFINFLFYSILIFLALVLIGFVFWRFQAKTIAIGTQLKIYQSIPGYRSIIRMQTSYLFAIHLSTLLKTGLHLKAILHILGKQTKQPILAFYCRELAAGLTKGVNITQLLPNFALLEKQFIAIFQKNTDTIALEKDLTVYAQVLIEELHRKMIKSITFIQPIFFVILAGFIVFVYASLMWPMFQLIKTI